MDKQSVDSIYLERLLEFCIQYDEFQTLDIKTSADLKNLEIEKNQKLENVKKSYEADVQKITRVKGDIVKNYNQIETFCKRLSDTPFNHYASNLLVEAKEVIDNISSGGIAETYTALKEVVHRFREIFKYNYRFNELKKYNWSRLQSGNFFSGVLSKRFYDEGSEKVQEEYVWLTCIRNVPGKISAVIESPDKCGLPEFYETIEQLEELRYNFALLSNIEARMSGTQTNFQSDIDILQTKYLDYDLVEKLKNRFDILSKCMSSKHFSEVLEFEHQRDAFLQLLIEIQDQSIQSHEGFELANGSLNDTEHQFTTAKQSMRCIIVASLSGWVFFVSGLLMYGYGKVFSGICLVWLGVVLVILGAGLYYIKPEKLKNIQAGLKTQQEQVSILGSQLAASNTKSINLINSDLKMVTLVNYFYSVLSHDINKKKQKKKQETEKKKQETEKKKQETEYLACKSTRLSAAKIWCSLPGSIQKPYMCNMDAYFRDLQSAIDSNGSRHAILYSYWEKYDPYKS